TVGDMPGIVLRELQQPARSTTQIAGLPALIAASSARDAAAGLELSFTDTGTFRRSSAFWTNVSGIGSCRVRTCSIGGEPRYPNTAQKNPTPPQIPVRNPSLNGPCLCAVATPARRSAFVSAPLSLSRPPEAE